MPRTASVTSSPLLAEIRLLNAAVAECPAAAEWTRGSNNVFAEPPRIYGDSPGISRRRILASKHRECQQRTVAFILSEFGPDDVMAAPIAPVMRRSCAATAHGGPFFSNFTLEHRG
jgi:hypothetical protein